MLGPSPHIMDFPCKHLRYVTCPLWPPSERECFYNTPYLQPTPLQREKDGKGGAQPGIPLIPNEHTHANKHNIFMRYSRIESLLWHQLHTGSVLPEVKVWLTWLGSWLIVITRTPIEMPRGLKAYGCPWGQVTSYSSSWVKSKVSIGPIDTKSSYVCVFSVCVSIGSRLTGDVWVS